MMRGLLTIAALALPCGAFVHVASPRRRAAPTRARGLLDGFTDALGKALENDPELLAIDPATTSSSAAPAPAARAAAAADPAADLAGAWRLELALVGVPGRDPSSDLSGPRASITERA